MTEIEILKLEIDGVVSTSLIRLPQRFDCRARAGLLRMWLDTLSTEFS